MLSKEKVLNEAMFSLRLSFRFFLFILVVFLPLCYV